MKFKRTRRILSFVLSLLLVLTLCTPTIAMAAEVETQSSDEVVIAVGETTTLKVSGWSYYTTWESSDTDVATVSRKGVVTGIAPGTAIITAISKGFYFGKQTKTEFTVKVIEQEESDAIQIKVGETTTLPAPSESGTTTWKSSDTSIATVSSEGVVTGLSKGTVTVTATTKSGGYKFWFFIWGETITTTKYTIVVIDDGEIPEPGKETFTVTFESNGGSAVEDQTVLEGDKVEKPEDPTKEGYTFGGWYVDEELTAEYDFDVAVTSDITLYAKWDEIPVAIFTVTFESNGGSAVEVQTVQEGDKVERPEDPIKEGYNFGGWYVDEELTTEYDFDAAVTSDITLYAKWESEIITYNIVFDSVGGSEVAQQEVKEGDIVTEPENPVKEGYLFSGWYLDETYSEKYDFSLPVMSSLILYAKWANEIVSVGEITREEWITFLVDTVGLKIDETTQYSFDDFNEVSEPLKIEAAIRHGVIGVEPDQDNMNYFNPDEYVTREYAATTAIKALKYTITDKDELPECDDINSLSYPDQDRFAVKLGMLDLLDSKFMPDRYLTQDEYNRFETVIQEIMESIQINPDAENHVEYVEGVEETNANYILNEDEKIVTLDSEITERWEIGEIHVLISADESQNDIAIKVTDIKEVDGQTVVSYETPALEEVVTSFDMEGTQAVGGVFMPADGVTVEDMEESEIATYAATSGEISLFGKKKVSLNVGDVSGEVVLDMKNLEYRFSADPSWHLITINEVYLCINSSVEYNLSYMKDGAENMEDITIGHFKCPIGYGFNASGDIKLIFSAEGGVEVGFEITEKVGVQYAKRNGIRPIFDVGFQAKSLALKGGIKGGVGFAVGAEFLGIDLVEVGPEGGLAVDGTVNNINIDNGEFCFDATAYVFLTLYAQIGWDDLNLRGDYELFNSDNSIWRDNYHFEETGKVEECTRGSGNYEGYVKASDSQSAIAHAKIQIYKGRELKDVTYTDENGKFVGIKLPSGSYTIHVSASGYLPYEQEFDIVGGQTTILRTQLMISRGSSGSGEESYSCSGMVTDAYNGIALADVEIKVISQAINPSDPNADKTVVTTVYTDTNGQYSFQAAKGNYKLVASKNEYVSNDEYVTLDRAQADINITLNPINQPTLEGNLRIVLTWGSSPSDLDSHLIAETNMERYHVYYSHMSDPGINLDVDDTSSYGPETITIENAETGTYSYYVHDYSNKGSSSSTALAQSEAQVKLYVGETLKYTISIPTDKDGTLWHVFDYDAESDRITLVNEFSYESSASNVGSNGVSTLSLDEDEKDTK